MGKEKVYQVLNTSVPHTAGQLHEASSYLDTAVEHNAECNSENNFIRARTVTRKQSHFLFSLNPRRKCRITKGMNTSVVLLFSVFTSIYPPKNSPSHSLGPRFAVACSVVERLRVRNEESPLCWRGVGGSPEISTELHFELCALRKSGSYLRYKICQEMAVRFLDYLGADLLLRLFFAANAPATCREDDDRVIGLASSSGTYKRRAFQKVNKFSNAQSGQFNFPFVYHIWD